MKILLSKFHITLPYKKTNLKFSRLDGRVGGEGGGVAGRLNLYDTGLRDLFLYFRSLVWLVVGLFPAVACMLDSMPLISPEVEVTSGGYLPSREAAR